MIGERERRGRVRGCVRMVKGKRREEIRNLMEGESGKGEGE